jgi:hypothetical protein
MKMRRRGVLALVLAGGLLVAACSSDNDASTATSPVPAHSDPSTSAQALVLHDDMRVLWEDHVAWTRLYIVSAVAGSPDTDATAARLLQNQSDIGEAVAVYYGDEAGADLTALLRDHILIAAELVTAAKAGDDAVVSDASTRWYANADEISVFLAGANPAWPEATVKDMMRTHLDQTLAEATAQLQGDYEQSIAEYDDIVTHIVMMADVLSDGIVTQFPERFAS